MRRAVALSSGDIGVEVLEGSEIPAGDVAIAAGDRDQLRPGLSLENMERRLLKMTLDATGGNRSRAAEMLGVSLRTVRNTKYIALACLPSKATAASMWSKISIKMREKNYVHD